MFVQLTVLYARVPWSLRLREDRLGVFEGMALRGMSGHADGSNRRLEKFEYVLKSVMIGSLQLLLKRSN